MGLRKFNHTEAERLLAYERYVALGSANLAAAELGVPPYAIRAAVRLLGKSPAELAAKGAEMRRQVSPDAELELLRMYKAGSTYAALANHFEVSLPAVRECVERAGVRERRRGPTPRLSNQQEEAILSAWRSGSSSPAISRSLATPASTVRRVIKSAGESMRRRHYPRGGRCTTQAGYILVLVPDGDSLSCMRNVGTGYILEHRLVMARSLGRPLLDTETVHHINGMRDDNRIENLQLRQGRHGKGACHRCADCGSENIIAVEIKEA